MSGPVLLAYVAFCPAALADDRALGSLPITSRSAQTWSSTRRCRAGFEIDLPGHVQSSDRAWPNASRLHREIDDIPSAWFDVDWHRPSPAFGVVTT